MYREYPPPPTLARYVSCFWESAPEKGRSRPAGVIVVPDACEDILIRAEADGPRLGASRIDLVGQMTRPTRPRSPAGSRIVAVRFHPGFLHTLARVPAAELRDLSAPTADVLPSLARELEELARPGSTPAQVLRRLEELLLRRFQDGPELPPVVEAGLEELRRTHGVLSLEALARGQGVSPRYLQRQFRERVGVAPKRLARVLRFQRAYLALARPDAPSATEVAAACGYFDQAHFTREFRQLAGRTPGEVRRSFSYKSDAALAA